MKNLKYALLFCIGCLLLSGCSSSGGLAPDNIENTVISFYETKVAAEEDKIYLNTNVIYHFKSGGIYENSIDGKSIDRGSYSYRIFSGKQEASIMFTYIENNHNYIYGQTMTFQTATSGTWVLTQTTNPKIKGVEEGTFKILSQP